MSFVWCAQELMSTHRCGRPRNESESPEEAMETLQEMAAVMREKATATHHMMEQIEGD